MVDAVSISVESGSNDNIEDALVDDVGKDDDADSTSVIDSTGTVHTRETQEQVQDDEQAALDDGDDDDDGDGNDDDDDDNEGE